MHGKRYERILRGRRGRGAVFLTLLLIIGMALSPCMSKSTWATEGNQPAPNAQAGTNCTLRVNPGTPSSVTVDIYKVAAYDAPYYSYGALTGDFSSVQALKALEDMGSLTASKYQELAKEAGKKVLGSGGARPVASASGSESSPAVFQGLSTGLYLMIVEGTYDPETVTTSTPSGTEKYIYAPQLIALPSTQEVVDENTVMKTSDGTWVFDVTAILKYETEPLIGDLEIVKNLLTYESRQKATFFYHIKVTYRDEVTGKDVTTSYDRTIICTKDGESAPVVITDLPVGAKVEVTEEYDGANYTYKSVVVNRPEKTIEHDEPLRFTFTNDYDTTDKGGGSIVNKFTAVDDGIVIDGKKEIKWNVDNNAVQKTYGQ